MSLRKRSPIPSSDARNDSLNVPRDGTGLSWQSMQSASPQHTGKVMKLHASPLFKILPQFLQVWILRFWFLSFLRPSWKPRHLLLLGSYLYKFQDEQSSRQRPKGAPISIEGIDVHVVGSNEDAVLEHTLRLLDGYQSVVCLSSLRKTYYFACVTPDEARAWVNSLREARQEAVTRSMGHAPRDSYPLKWAYFDSLGSSLLESKDRIRSRMERSNLRELEMIHLTDSAGSPRGFYG